MLPRQMDHSTAVLASAGRQCSWQNAHTLKVIRESQVLWHMLYIEPGRMQLGPDTSLCFCTYYRPRWFAEPEEWSVTATVLLCLRGHTNSCIASHSADCVSSQVIITSRLACCFPASCSETDGQTPMSTHQCFTATDYPCCYSWHQIAGSTVRNQTV